MRHEFTFDDEHSFLEKVRAVARDLKPGQTVETFSPIPVPEADELLKPKPTMVRLFAIAGALTGTLSGFALTIYSVLRWPMLITGGKPLVSILPFVIIAFELTILLGALSTFGGFLLLARLPSVPKILRPADSGNQYVIVVEGPDEQAPGH